MSTLTTAMLGIVLAGGQSSRMGTDKANLSIYNKTLLEHTISLLISYGIKLVCISGRQYGNEWVLDALPDRGPLGGIYSVLKTKKYKKYELALIVPIDMPLLNCKIIDQLITHINQYHAVCYDNYPLPLLLKNDLFLIKNIEAMFNQPGSKFSIKHLLSLLSTKYIDTSIVDQKHFTNVNTDDEWHNCKHIM
jgi:molybdenum cofactor guanylyltransferase